MDAAGVAPTLATYDALLEVLPQNTALVNRTILDAIWPRSTVQSEAALDLLCRMEEEGVIPESRTHETLLKVFGRASAPVLKCRRMAFWMRRFAFANPYRLATPPSGPFETASHFTQRLAGPASTVELVCDDPDGFTTVAAHPAGQSQLVEELCQQAEDAGSIGTLYIDSSGHSWFLGQHRPYYTLLAEQGGAQHVLSVCACLNSNADAADAADSAASLDLWVQRILQEHSNLEAFRLIG